VWPVAALVGGGVVVLALVVMVGVYLLTTRSKPAGIEANAGVELGAGSRQAGAGRGPGVGAVAGAVAAGALNQSESARAGKAGFININTASAAELALLPGVGKSLAEAIIAYRGKHGPFRSVAELDKVPGIGPKKLAEITPLATVE
jgi:competence protein ComEA